jgi:glycosyltransferase involved in cell wall biosynthesis
MAKVSVIVPVYNTEQYISRCIDSVLGQTFTDFELIAVDDGSADHSPQLLEGYAGKDHRLKVIRQKNQGVASARNKGLSAASGEYIVFIDSDDWVHPRYLEVLTDMITLSGADIAVCGLEYVSGEQGSECALSKEYSLRKLPDCRNDWTIAFFVTGKMYNRHCIDGMSFADLENEDKIFNFDVFTHKPDIVLAVTDSKGYYYFQREGSRERQAESGELRIFRFFQHAQHYYSHFLTETDPDIKITYLKAAKRHILLFLQDRKDCRNLYKKHAREFRALMKNINRAVYLVEEDKRKRILFACYAHFPFLFELNLWIHKINE